MAGLASASCARWTPTAHTLCTLTREVVRTAKSPGPATPAKPAKPLCGGARKHNRGPCRRPAGWGTGHAGVGKCKLHGGSTPNHEKAGQQQLLELEARTAFGRLSDHSNPVTDPLSALSALAGHVTAWMEFLAGRISALEQLAWEGEFTGEQIKGEIVLFERSMDRCSHVLTAMARLNIDQRLAKVSERQVEIVTAAITASLAELGLNAEQQREARSGVVRHLRLVTG